MSLSSRVPALLSRFARAGHGTDAQPDAVAKHLLALHAAHARHLAHDLKNDLQVLSGSLELLRMHVDRGADGAELQALLTQAQSAVSDAESRFAMYDPDMQAPLSNTGDASSCPLVDLNRQVRAICSAKRENTAYAGRLHVDLHPGSLWIDIDAGYLHLLLHALLVSATGAIAKQGNVLISSGVADTVQAGDAQCCVTVSADCVLPDPGIPATLARQFAMQVNARFTRGVGASIELVFPLHEPAGSPTRRPVPA